MHPVRLRAGKEGLLQIVSGGKMAPRRALAAVSVPPFGVCSRPWAVAAAGAALRRVPPGSARSAPRAASGVSGGSPLRRRPPVGLRPRPPRRASCRASPRRAPSSRGFPALSLRALRALPCGRALRSALRAGRACRRGVGCCQARLRSSPRRINAPRALLIILLVVPFKGVRVPRRASRALDGQWCPLVCVPPVYKP